MMCIPSNIIIRLDLSIAPKPKGEREKKGLNNGRENSYHVFIVCANAFLLDMRYNYFTLNLARAGKGIEYYPLL